MLPTVLSLAVLVCANVKQHNFRGITVVSSVNAFGKALECVPLDDPVEPRFELLRNRVRTYCSTHPARDPWLFMLDFPEYNRDCYALVGSFGRSALITHRRQYLACFLTDLLVLLQAEPYFGAPFNVPIPDWVERLRLLSVAELKLSRLIPLMLLALAWSIRRCPSGAESPRLRLGLILSAWALATDLTAAALGYGDYYRVRSPFDWVMILLAVWAVTALLRRVTQAGPGQPLQKGEACDP